MRLYTLLFGILLGAILHHHLVKDQGSHNPFDRAVEKGEAKVKEKVEQIRDADQPQTAATEMARETVQKLADKVGDTADKAAEKVSDVADKAASKVSEGAEKAAGKTRSTAKKAAGAAKDGAEKVSDTTES